MHLYIYIDTGWKTRAEFFPEMLLEASWYFPLGNICNSVELQIKQWNTECAQVTFCLRATFHPKSLDKQKEHERVRLCYAASYSARTTRSNQSVPWVSNLPGDYSICMKQAEDLSTADHWSKHLLTTGDLHFSEGGVQIEETGLYHQLQLSYSHKMKNKKIPSTEATLPQNTLAVSMGREKKKP